MPVSRGAFIALGLAVAMPFPSLAADPPPELRQLRDQIAELRQAYEARLQALEQRITGLQSPTAAPPPAVPPPSRPAAAPPAGAAAAVAGNAFNPAISLILAGTYARLSRDPARYRIQGFVPTGGEVGPGGRSFQLGESELGISANIDPLFAGRLTAALGADNSVGVEEAWFERQGVFPGATLRGGRFLSSIGYLNDRHAHTWDFVDSPLAYQAFFGGPIKTDGLQLRWLAPTQRFLEFGAELGAGRAFPGSDSGRNGVGSTALFAHAGDDWGANASWRIGASLLQQRARDRRYNDTDAAGTPVTNSFSGRSRTWVLDGIYKWAPGGNARSRNLQVQGEYFRRSERGSLAYDIDAQAGGPATGTYRAGPSGWYLQAVYQFIPQWRAGVRIERLDSGTPRLGTLGSTGLLAADFPLLQRARPSRAALMVDYSLSEFSRLRLQLGGDRSNPNATDRQLFLQYIMSLGAHGAHRF